MTASPYPLQVEFQEKEPNIPRRRVASCPATRQLEQKTSHNSLMEAAKSNTELEENRHYSNQQAPTPYTTGKNFQEKEPNIPRHRLASWPATRQLERKTSHASLTEAAKSNRELEENRHCSGPGRLNESDHGRMCLKPTLPTTVGNNQVFTWLNSCI
ncbi:hypothetical protein CEXT_536691 [Caerostris extrusa]|uniref:Uncharacterized protein n=1 Tax=Caerostris extrusa TaxID=172846 RepID=A0AAV4QL78_CAEEX|nr:hypothetical protein CEXT_536691 [Caerostris extrusa]